MIFAYRIIWQCIIAILGPYFVLGLFLKIPVKLAPVQLSRMEFGSKIRSNGIYLLVRELQMSFTFDIIHLCGYMFIVGWPGTGFGKFNNTKR